MMVLLILLFILLLSYILLMLLYEKGWRLQPAFAIPENFIPATKITVIIPARNEEATIAMCVRSIFANDYPKELYEIIVIDDHSTDRTYEVVQSLGAQNVKCLKLKDFLNGAALNSYKKKAIETAIAHSTGALLITTDADCIAEKNWLKNIAALYEQQQPVMIIGAVKFATDKSVLSVFQSLDFMSMQGITAAAHRMKLGNMCNGANLAFSRDAFYEVEGYKNIDHLASGDDYLLMMKMHHRFPDKIAYIKNQDAVISTLPQPTWKSFLNQRIRWASKMGKYDDKTIVAVLMLVYLFNLSFLFLFIAGFFDVYFWLLGSSMLVIKTVTELFYLRNVAHFFRKERELLYFSFLQPLHILYIIVAGFLGFIGKYEWKGRNVK